MGLVARVIEAAGIPTVTLNMIWVYQRIVGMPRVAAIEHPFGRPFGNVGDQGGGDLFLDLGRFAQLTEVADAERPQSRHDTLLGLRFLTEQRRTGRQN